MDTATLAWAVIVVLFTLAALLVLVAAARRNGALACWAAGMAGSALGVLAMYGSFGANLPPWVGNILVLAFLFTLPVGMGCFLQRPQPWPARFSVYLGLLLVLSVVFSVVIPSRPARGTVLAGGMIVLTGEFLRLLRDPALEVHALIRRSLVLLGGAYLAAFLVRGAAFWFSASPNARGGGLEGLATLWSILVFSILWTGMLLLLDGGRLQAKLAAHTEELRRLNALKDRVLAMTSHDLRGPLGNLRLLWAELGRQVQKGECLDPEQDLIAIVDRSLAGTQSLLENLFSFAESQQAVSMGTPECNLGLAAETVLQQWGPLAAAKGVDFKVVAASLVVEADFGAVLTTLRNLVANAVKFTPTGGSVVLEVTALEPWGAVVEVRDTGIGMGPETSPQDFRLESRKSRPGTAGERGSGFGLVLVQEMVASWNGSLDFRSKPGRGTVVRVGFPR